MSAVACMLTQWQRLHVALLIADELVAYEELGAGALGDPAGLRAIVAAMALSPAQEDAVLAHARAAARRRAGR